MQANEKKALGVSSSRVMRATVPDCGARVYNIRVMVPIEVQGATRALGDSSIRVAMPELRECKCHDSQANEQECHVHKHHQQKY